jgi:cyclopropane-fatty-acyl-phospholipid synthase
MPTEALETLSQGHAFEIVARGEDAKRWMSRGDAYSAALAYVQGVIDVQGDLIEAVRYQLAHTGATCSCAYFREPGVAQGEDSLDHAQLSKLDHICRKLRVQNGDRFLDVGCGWGALVIHAAQSFGAIASGCTLSIRQAEHAAERVRQERLAAAVSIHEMDYRDVRGEFDRIASVAMFEHVGRAQIETYFRKIYSLLAPDGLFLNHGITRPVGVHSDAQSMFIARKVFPGFQVLRLDEVIRTAERGGFEVLDVENLRRHYALTCRTWVERLDANRDACLRAVDEETWRTWKLYLAGCTIAFENGHGTASSAVVEER